MAKLLDLLVAAEHFVPVAGRVYAQDGGGAVWEYTDPRYCKEEEMWVDHSARVPLQWWPVATPGLAEDYQTAVITAESILEARACL